MTLLVSGWIFRFNDSIISFAVCTFSGIASRAVPVSFVLMYFTNADWFSIGLVESASSIEFMNAFNSFGSPSYLLVIIFEMLLRYVNFSVAIVVFLLLSCKLLSPLFGSPRSSFDVLNITSSVRSFGTFMSVLFNIAKFPISRSLKYINFVLVSLLSLPLSP